MRPKPKLVKAVIRPRNQITLPPEIITLLGVETGDTIQFTMARDGRTIQIHPLRLYQLSPEPAVQSVDEQLETAAYGGPQW